MDSFKIPASDPDIVARVVKAEARAAAKKEKKKAEAKKARRDAKSKIKQNEAKYGPAPSPIYLPLERGPYKKRLEKTYRAWRMMNQRCYNKKHPSYDVYGGRGVTVHPDWHVHFGDKIRSRECYMRFLNHVGVKPYLSASLDRVDPNWHYTYGNVRWSSPKIQANNKCMHQQALQERASRPPKPRKPRFEPEEKG